MTTRTDPSERPAFRVRLEVLFASQASQAVILRRGPKTHFQLISWDTKTDKLQPGQWMKGHIELYDLSPGGKYLIYRAAQYHRSRDHWQQRNDDNPYDPAHDQFRTAIQKLKKRNKPIPRYMRGGKKQLPIRQNTGTWTAISRPPWFTALAIWPSHGTWTGGGVFTSERKIVLFENEEGMTPKQNAKIPPYIQIDRLGDWRDQFGHPKPNAHRTGPNPVAAKVSHALDKCGVRFFEWAEPAGRDNVVFACDGAIYRLQNWRTIDAADYLTKARKIADFNADQFTRVAPPTEALRW